MWKDCLNFPFVVLCWWPKIVFFVKWSGDRKPNERNISKNIHFSRTEQEKYIRDVPHFLLLSVVILRVGLLF